MNFPTAVSRRDAMLLALGGVLTATPARTDDYPSRPVKIVAPFGAGGPTDVYTRSIANELQKSLGQTFFIEDRPGARMVFDEERLAERFLQLVGNGARVDIGRAAGAEWRDDLHRPRRIFVGAAR